MQRHQETKDVRERPKMRWRGEADPESNGRQGRAGDSVEQGSEEPVRAWGRPAGPQIRVLADRWGERDDCRDI